MYVYDYEKFKGQTGTYCPAQDATSESIDSQGSWEDRDTAVIKPILESSDLDKIVIDAGCHVGWYTVMAANLGYKVVAIDGDAENLRLLKMNLELHDLTDLVEVHHLWFDESTKLKETRSVKLMKIDIEGAERHAIEVFKPLIEAGKVENIYLEVSPEFNDSYPALLAYLKQYYSLFYDDGRPWDDDYSKGQINLLCRLDNNG